MDTSLLDILRCPFCGSRLRVVEGAARGAEGGRVSDGILGCQCCAYPVVSGVPFLRTGKAAAAAMGRIGKGDFEGALTTLMGLDEPRRAQFQRLLTRGPEVTFREALRALIPDAEADYLLYRFSDPTFLCSRAVLEAVGQDRRCFAGRVLDVGGGAGHLTRTLCRLAGGPGVVLADVSFPKLWLARRFVAPGCEPVCCDANEPLPFARDAFSLVFCADAFHYVWSRRLLAGEMLRLAGGGVVLLTHLHNLLAENESAGMPLAPEDYRNLFEGVEVGLFKESEVLDGVLAGGPLDLSAPQPDARLGGEPALVLLATRLAGFFRPYPRRGVKVEGDLAINPLYRREREGDAEFLRLRFPSQEYEAEYAACKRYLPERVSWGGVRDEGLRAGTLDAEAKRLLESGVLLELPRGYY